MRKLFENSGGCMQDGAPATQRETNTDRPPLQLSFPVLSPDRISNGSNVAELNEKKS